MQQNKGYDAIVIGGGMTGCATAYYLARGGMSVALIEKRSICSGASGRNGGQVIQVEGRDELNREVVSRKNSIGYHGKALLDTLNEELDYDIEYRKTGGLDLAYTEGDEKTIQRIIEDQHAVGDRGVEYLGPDETREVCPVLGDTVRGAKYRKDDGNANPFNIAHGFLLAALRKGLDLFTYTNVLSVIMENDRAVGVSTDRGDFRADQAVINATNAWTMNLFEEFPVVPCKILAFVTEQLPIIPMPPTESVIRDQPGDVAYNEEDTQPYLYYGGSQTTGNVIIGGPPVFMPDGMDDHFNESITYEDIMRFRTLFSRYWVKLRDVSLIRGWGGALGFTPDSYPLVGPTRYENLYMNTGFTNGMCWCPICGKLLSEHILEGGKTSVPIDFMNPERFAGETFEWPRRYNYTKLHNYISAKHAV